MSMPRRLVMPRRPAGFTMVEIIIVMIISGIIAGILAAIIRGPIEGYIDQSRRAELVNTADSALRRMQRDIRHALPNSVRIRTSVGNVGDASCPTNDSICVIEILHTVDGGRYCADPRCTEPPGAAGDPLRFNGADTEFDALGGLQNTADIDTANHWVVINNQTDTGNLFNAYSASGHNRVQLSAGSTNLAASPPHVALASAFNVSGGNPSPASPRQRFFVVDTPITYLCNTTTGTLTRYDGYTITATHASADTHAELTALANAAEFSRVSDLVVDCRFTYQAGTSQRAGLVTLTLTLRDNSQDSSEQVRLLHQIHVYNVP